MLNILLLFSCSSDANGKDKLASTLFSPFSLEADYTFASGEKSVCGKVRITKSDNTRLDILSPDPYTGISVESDGSGNASSYSISFSGIKAEIPKSVTDKLSLTFSLFSPEIPVKIKKLDSKCFSDSKELCGTSDIKNCEPCTSTFSNGEINYSITYDKNTGALLLLNVWHGESSVTLTITKFKLQNTERK